MILITVPISGEFINSHTGLDDVFNYYYNIAEINKLDFYDFNLLRTNAEIIANDKSCFYDSTHLCTKGSDLFMTQFLDIIQNVNLGEDVSYLFYSSYEEMKADSPYMKILNQN